MRLLGKYTKKMSNCKKILQTFRPIEQAHITTPANSDTLAVKLYFNPRIIDKKEAIQMDDLILIKLASTTRQPS